MAQPMRWDTVLACGCPDRGEADKTELPDPGDEARCTAHGETEVVRMMARSK